MLCYARICSSMTYDLTWPHCHEVEVEESIRISECNGRSGLYAWKSYSILILSLSLFIDIQSVLSLFLFLFLLTIVLVLSLFLSPPPFFPLHSSSLSPWSILSRLLIPSHIISHPTLILSFILPLSLPLSLPLPLLLHFLNNIQPSSVILLLSCDHKTKSVKEKRNETSSLYRNVMRISLSHLNQSSQSINSNQIKIDFTVSTKSSIEFELIQFNQAFHSSNYITSHHIISYHIFSTVMLSYCVNLFICHPPSTQPDKIEVEVQNRKLTLRHTMKATMLLNSIH